MINGCRKEPADGNVLINNVSPLDSNNMLEFLDKETGNCYLDPINKMYQNYHFKGHNNGNYNGPCTGTRQVIATWKNTYKYKANDGVVLAESAGKPLKSLITPITIKMPDTNHEQMKNSMATKLALQELYKGTYGSLFKVETR